MFFGDVVSFELENASTRASYEAKELLLKEPESILELLWCAESHPNS